MPQPPFSQPSPDQTPCTVCEMRPAVTRIAYQAGSRRGTADLCEVCAADAMQGNDPRVSAAARGELPGQPNHVPFGSVDEDASATPALDEFSRDLTEDAREGRVDPVIGRDSEVEQVIEVLARRRKNNAVLIGEAGVGKTAIAEALALRIASGDVPETLEGVRLVTLDLAGMIAGAQYRGQFEQRFKQALEEVADSDGQIVVFLDEIHTILGAGNAEGAMDAANMLKPLLARGEVRLVGATTLAEYRSIERDSALARRFSAIHVDEPSVDDTVAILRGLRAVYEQHHGVAIADEALEAAARLSDRYVTDQQLPDKAIDLVDQASARLRLHGGAAARSEAAVAQAELDAARTAKDTAVRDERYEDAAGHKVEVERLEARVAELRAAEGEAVATVTHIGPTGLPTVTETDVAAVIASRTGIPVGELVAAELERLGELEADLHARVIGQEQAVGLVADTVRRARVGLADADKPLGSFLFLGPTGVGKTELVKALAERLFATEKALVRIDMSEFREPHTVARLIGSPPGYVGYGDGGQLTEPVRRRPYSVVLLDEVEKAHPDVWNVLLQLMDDGRLTDGEGRTVDFTNTVVVMTSNLGGGRSKRGVGFGASTETSFADSERMVAAARSAFLPEFLNRIDEVLTFDALSAPQIESIASLVVARVAERLRLERGIELEVTPELVSRLGREGFDEELGARPLNRHVRRTLERELTQAILDGRLADGAHVTARDAADGTAIELVVDEGAPVQQAWPQAA